MLRTWRSGDGGHTENNKVRMPGNACPANRKGGTIVNEYYVLYQELTHYHVQRRTSATGGAVVVPLFTVNTALEGVFAF